MNRKFIFAVFFLLLGVLLSTGLATSIFHPASGEEGIWNDEANWDNGIPSTVNRAIVADGTCIIDVNHVDSEDTNAVKTNHIDVGRDADGTLLITGGSITVTDRYCAGYNAGKFGIIQQDAGDVSVAGTMYIARQGIGTYILNGGTIHALGNFISNDNASTGASLLDLNGGLLHVAGDMELGRVPGSADANCTINDANLITGLDLRIGYGGDGTHTSTCNFYSGLMQIGDELSVGKAYGKGIFNMYGGTLEILGTAGGSGGDMIATRNQPTGIGTYNIYGGSIYVADDVVLGVGISTSAGGQGILNMMGGTLDIEGDIVLSAEDVPAGTAELNIHGGTITATSLQLYPSSTIDFENGTLILDGDVQGQLLGLAAENIITTFGVNGTRGGLLIQYNEANDVTTVTGDANGFDVAKAWFPQPAGAGAPINAVLSWNAGDYADKHNVYFGTSLDDVNQTATAVSVEQTSTTYSPGGLKFGQVYYWRIDEVKLSPSQTWTGDIWSFTVGIPGNIAGYYEVVDDFENYQSDSELLNVWTEGDDSMLSVAVNPDSLDPEKVMKFDYPGYAERAFSPSLDMVEADAAFFEISLFGDLSNTDIQFGLQLKDSDGDLGTKVMYPTPEDMFTASWYLWQVKLSDLAGGNLDLDKISSLIISIDSVNWGLIYVDNVLLWSPTCVAEFGPTGDVTGDCTVDMFDVYAMGSHWLDKSIEIYPNEPAAPVLWYKFDETTGTTAEDFIGDSNAVLTLSGDWKPGQGHDGSGALNFDGTYYGDMKNESAVFTSKLENQITISLWLKGDINVDYTQAHNVFGAANVTGQIATLFRCPQIIPPAGSGDVTWRHGAPAYDMLRWDYEEITEDDYKGVWKHYALVKDTTEGIQQIYRDGELVAEMTDAYNGVDITAFLLGAESGVTSSRLYEGMMDDFQIYDYPLSAEEVRYLAGQDAFVQPLSTAAKAADVFDDDQIDFKDFSELGADWMTQQLWP
jgi:hypothetical protein